MRPWNYIWINIIDDIVKEYNNKIHSTIQIQPSKVNKKNEKFILKNIYLKRDQKFQSLGQNKVPKFKLNDFVRISKFKKTFEKGFTRNYTPEIFKIVAVNKKFPFTYLLEDYQKTPISGRFYEKELLLVKYPNNYLVEKVIKTRDDQSYVKWLGFDKSHNSWVKNQDIV